MAEYRTVIGKDGIARKFKVTKLDSRYRPTKPVIGYRGRVGNSNGKVDPLMVPANSRMGTDY
jgi:hypothetical protein